jgi:hypothetical protein
MNVRRWLKDRRTLLADIDRQRDMLTVRDIEIRDLHDLIEETEDRDGARIAQLQESLRHTRKLLSAHEAKNAQLVEELRALRDDIRREEHDTQTLAAGGFGMVRWPEPIADVIAQETAMKRRLDL